jgi:hypothetical protein
MKSLTIISPKAGESPVARDWPRWPAPVAGLATSQLYQGCLTGDSPISNHLYRIMIRHCTFPASKSSDPFAVPHK